MHDCYADSFLELVSIRFVCGFLSIIFLRTRRFFAGTLAYGKENHRSYRKNLPKIHMQYPIGTGSYISDLLDNSVFAVHKQRLTVADYAVLGYNHLSDVGIRRYYIHRSHKNTFEN